MEVSNYLWNVMNGLVRTLDKDKKLLSVGLLHYVSNFC